jgi:hypothetical protein
VSLREKDELDEGQEEEDEDEGGDSQSHGGDSISSHRVEKIKKSHLFLSNGLAKWLADVLDEFVEAADFAWYHDARDCCAPHEPFSLSDREPAVCERRNAHLSWGVLRGLWPEYNQPLQRGLLGLATCAASTLNRTEVRRASYGGDWL